LFFNLRVGKWDLPKWDLHQKWVPLVDGFP
jgi:hypothetical protein